MREYDYIGDPNPRTMFVEGPFNSGKTDFAIETLFAWLNAGIPPQNILITVPQRTLARPFILALRSPGRAPSGDVSIRTLNGLAQDTVAIYWPLIAGDFGFKEPNLDPRYLTIETAQYAIGRFVDEAVERGEFDAIKVSPQTIGRQIIDNLGKAAIMGIHYSEIPDLLTAAWGPERPRKRVLAYQAAARVAAEYRQFCLNNRLLDYALQIELLRSLLDLEQVNEWFFGHYTHLIALHLEEDAALTHNLIAEWLPQLQGALLTYEWDGGFRVFLNAEPEYGYGLRDRCDGIMVRRPDGGSPQIEALMQEIAHGMNPDEVPATDTDELGYTYAFHNYFPEMLDWVADRVQMLIEDGTSARDIAVLSPFLSDALLFSLRRKLAARGIQSVSHRPSRALRDEPSARSLLTLTALAHPHWGMLPPQADVADALRHTLNIDPVRAQLLTKIVYRASKQPPLSPFTTINADMQARITYRAGERYETLRTWLTEGYPGRYDGQTAPLDHFFSLLFGEVLSQPEFGFHDDPDAGRVTAELIESANKFRQSLYTEGVSLDAVGSRYFGIVQQGLLGALYLASWRDELADAVFIAPAYTFLMRNRAVDVQFWLDLGSGGWWERLDQPLTHPYVLSQMWQHGTLWTDDDEIARQREMLYRITTGLLRRTRQHVYLGISDLGEQGFEQRGPLLTVFQGILQRHPQTPDQGADDE